MLESALSYARRGWKIVPLHNPITVPTPEKGGCSCGKDDCENQGKHPRWHQKDLANGLLNATNDESIIKTWWGRWPKANIAIVTGAASGIVVLDIDAQEGWDYLEQNEIYLPRTRQTITSPGKAHIYFAHPGFEVRNFAKKIPGMDFRGDGGYVVAPPSLHRTGSVYKWNEVEGVADCPNWLLGFFKEGVAPGSPLASAGKLTGEVRISDTDLLPPEVAKDWANLIAEGVEDGSRNHSLASLTGHYIQKGLTDGEIFQFLLPFIHRCQPPLADKDLLKTIASVRRTHERNNLITNAIPGGASPAVGESLKIESNDDRNKLVEAIGAKLGIPLQQIFRMLGDETKFIFKVDGREVWMATAELFNFKSFQVKIADLTKRAVMKDKKIPWELICQRIMDAAEDIQPGPEATVTGKLRAAIVGYLEGHPVQDEVGMSQDPFFLDGRIALYLTPLKKYLKMNCDEKIPDLPQRLKSLGAESCHQTLKSKTRRFWLLAPGFKIE
jgi:hypothetical protein